jgi:hypothetical protein
VISFVVIAVESFLRECTSGTNGRGEGGVVEGLIGEDVVNVVHCRDNSGERRGATREEQHSMLVDL